MRLPKPELKKFGGEILKWQEFWDTFEASIHKNSSLQPIDKLRGQRGQLERDALKTVSGLELTNSNYDATVAILKERYGNEQLKGPGQHRCFALISHPRYPVFLSF